MSDNNVEKIKDRLNIVDVVGSYIKLEKAGSNLKACCPFHNEKTPSFFVSPTRETYKCFGCGEGGDIFSFVEKFEGVDFRGSLKILAEQAGIKLKKEDPRIVDERKRIYSVLEEATLYFENNLKKNKLVLEYLKNRGVTQRTINHFRLGFANDSWQNLYDFLKKKNYTDIEIEKAGLIKKNERGNRFYDRFRNRIIFPLFDNSDQPVAFSGRFFGEDDKEGIMISPNTTSQYGPAKYLNSPETILFNKSSILYGYNFARLKIRKRDFSILVEGQMDLLMCHQAGYDNTVASSGTALSQDHINLLKRLSDRVVIAFDGDKAGFLSACRVTKIALIKGMEVRLMNIPEGLDPADFILKDKKSWEKELKEAKHIVDFYLNKLTTEINNIPNQTTSVISRKLGKAVQEKVLPFVAVLSSDIEKANFVKEISDKLDIPDKVIWTELEKINRGTSFNVHQGEGREFTFIDKPGLSIKSKKNRKQIILRQISGIYWWQKGKEDSVFDLQELGEDIKNIIGDKIFDKIENLNEKIKDEIIFEVEILYGETENITEKVKELFRNLEIELIDEKIKNVIKEQKQAENEGKTKKAFKKMEKFNKLSKEKSNLIK